MGTDSDAETASTPETGDNLDTGTINTGATPLETGGTPETGDSEGFEELPPDHPALVALRKANERARDQAAALKKFEDRDKTDLQLAQETLETEKAGRTAAEVELRRLRAAVRHGLGDKDLDLLGTGSDEEIDGEPTITVLPGPAFVNFVVSSGTQRETV